MLSVIAPVGVVSPFTPPTVPMTRPSLSVTKMPPETVVRAANVVAAFADLVKPKEDDELRCSMTNVFVSSANERVIDSARRRPNAACRRSEMRMQSVRICCS